MAAGRCPASVTMGLSGRQAGKACCGSAPVGSRVRVLERNKGWYGREKSSKQHSGAASNGAVGRVSSAAAAGRERSSRTKRAEEREGRHAGWAWRRRGPLPQRRAAAAGARALPLRRPHTGRSRCARRLEPFLKWRRARPICRGAALGRARGCGRGRAGPPAKGWAGGAGDAPAHDPTPSLPSPALAPPPSHPPTLGRHATHPRQSAPCPSSFQLSLASCAHPPLSGSVSSSSSSP